MDTPRQGATSRFSAGMAVALAIGLLAVAQIAFAAGPAAPGLGTAGSFAVLAGAGITNTGPTTIKGDVGSYPTTTQTGFGSVTLSGGTNHAGDAVTQGAQTDLTTAYNTAAGSGPTTPVAADLAEAQRKTRSDTRRRECRERGSPRIGPPRPPTGRGPHRIDA